MKFDKWYYCRIEGCDRTFYSESEQERHECHDWHCDSCGESTGETVVEIGPNIQCPACENRRKSGTKGLFRIS